MLSKPEARDPTALRPAPAVPSRRHAVSWRAIIAGLLLTPLNVFFLVSCNFVSGSFTEWGSLFVHGVALLFALALLNGWLKRRRPGLAFSAGEMLTVYLMIGIPSGLTCGNYDLGGSLAATISYPFWFASAGNNWQQLIWPYLPGWLTVQDRGVLEGFYAGSVNPYTPSILAAWARPAFWWSTLIGAIMWICLCLNSIVRRRWEDEEKLPFPITALPVQLADERFGLLRNRLFWTAVGLEIVILLWNTLASLFPAVPAVPMGYDYTSYIANRHPWDFIRYPVVGWDGLIVGLCYLMPLDLAFSLLFFDLFWTAEWILSGYFGWATSAWAGFPYAEQQTTGGFIALLGGVLWLDRKYLAQVLRRAAGLPSQLREEGNEAFSYRAAVLGAVAGVAYLWWLLARGGMQYWAVVTFIALYFVMALMFSRIRAQLGPPILTAYGVMPDWVLMTVTGSVALGPRTIGMLTLLRPYLGQQRNNPVPLQLEGLKMAEDGRMERNRIALAMAIVAPLGMLCYFWATMHLGYNLGLGTAHTNIGQLDAGRSNTLWMDALQRVPTEPDVSGESAMGFGAVFVLALTFLKMRFHWWPLHPIAFLIAPSGAVEYMTIAIFVTWLFKLILLRYGGLRAHRRALPFFLGLLAGQSLFGTVLRILLNHWRINIG